MAVLILFPAKGQVRTAISNLSTNGMNVTGFIGKSYQFMEGM